MPVFILRKDGSPGMHEICFNYFLNIFGLQWLMTLFNKQRRVAGWLLFVQHLFILCTVYLELRWDGRLWNSTES